MPRFLSRRPLLWGVLALLVAALVGVTMLRAPRGDAAPVVLAAASLQEAMGAAADAWAAKGHPRPVLSFAASSALARQAASGATADLFASADEAWMDDLEQRGAIVPESRATFLANRLVLIARADFQLPPERAGGHDVASLVRAGDRLAMADTDAVPAGRYGKAALEHLHQWERVAPHVVRAENVRAALALVERGAAPLGIVYATDAAASDKVRVLATFPENSHPPIRYPLARLKASTSPDAEPFRNFLLSPEAAAIFARFGFSPLAG
ncbi:molybdate ABC transporter substrate-binding protein [Sphingosinithalassobacter tenebrarum]|uniref:Molybdate ABC transporter substrate-binding protein n=2 Tax=Stakelama tenebrarum TaxID=2711215 RepID=A0A6G6YAA9_9SPHN|nr:molybdate ABC transporter substrate-binding protein [Sphingosinithalassobacter tenebrarum]